MRRLVLTALLLVTACSDTFIAGCAARVDDVEQRVTCYSASGAKIYEGHTRGVMHGSGGTMTFRDIDTGRVVRATGHCVAEDVRP